MYNKRQNPLFHELQVGNTLSRRPDNYVSGSRSSFGRGEEIFLIDKNHDSSPALPPRLGYLDLPSYYSSNALSFVEITADKYGQPDSEFSFVRRPDLTKIKKGSICRYVTPNEHAPFGVEDTIVRILEVKPYPERDCFIFEAVEHHTKKPITIIMPSARCCLYLLTGKELADQIKAVADTITDQMIPMKRQVASMENALKEMDSARQNIRNLISTVNPEFR